MFERFGEVAFRVSLEAAYLLTSILSHGRPAKDVIGVLDLDNESMLLADSLLRSIEEAESTVVAEMPLGNRRRYIAEIDNCISELTRLELRGFDDVKGMRALAAIRRAGSTIAKGG